MATEHELNAMRDVVRKCKVRALKDIDGGTHLMSKGKVYEVDSDIAAGLIEKEAVELSDEPMKQQATLPTSRAEKRG